MHSCNVTATRPASGCAGMYPGSFGDTREIQKARPRLGSRQGVAVDLQMLALEAQVWESMAHG